MWNLERTFQLNDYIALRSDISSLDYSHLLYLAMAVQLVPENFHIAQNQKIMTIINEKLKKRNFS